jgi:hypothetical protein
MKSVNELFYCGLVRNFTETCEKSYISCSSPGSMFDIPARKSVDIVWVNRLDPNILPDVKGTCFDMEYQPDGKSWPEFCLLMAKINRTQTYLDPTGMTELHSSIS